MTVKELIPELQRFNQDAEVSVVVNCREESFSLSWSSPDSKEDTRKITKSVHFYVDRLCTNES